MNKEFKPSDRVQLEDNSQEGPMPIPHMTCSEAGEMVARFKSDALTAGEAFMLGIHLLSPKNEPHIEHEPACPSHDEDLKERVLVFIRQNTGA